MNFISHLHKSNRFDLIDMFNYNSCYLDNIFAIDNQEFQKHIPGQSKYFKEMYFLCLEIKVDGINSNIHNSVYEKRDYF